jgi:hypothetical protein
MKSPSAAAAAAAQRARRRLIVGATVSLLVVALAANFVVSFHMFDKLNNESFLVQALHQFDGSEGFDRNLGVDDPQYHEQRREEEEEVDTQFPIEDPIPNSVPPPSGYDTFSACLLVRFGD